MFLRYIYYNYDDVTVPVLSGESHMFLTGISVKIVDTSGDVEVSGIRLAAITDSSGDVVIENDSSGDIEIEHVGGSVEVVADSTGERAIADVRGSITVPGD